MVWFGMLGLEVAGPVHLGWDAGSLRVPFIWFGMLGLEFASPVHLVWMLGLCGSSSSGLRCWVFAGPDVVWDAGS